MQKREKKILGYIYGALALGSIMGHFLDYVQVTGIFLLASAVALWYSKGTEE